MLGVKCSVILSMERTKAVLADSLIRGAAGRLRSAGLATAWFANHMEVSEARIEAFADAIDQGWFEA